MKSKILIISSYAPPAISGSPLMMYKILKYFPKTSYVILTSRLGMSEAALKTGQWLKGKYYFFDSFKDLSNNERQNKNFFHVVKEGIKKIKLLTVFAHLISITIIPINILLHAKKIVRIENINKILVFSDHGPALLSAWMISRFFRLPLHLHMYDLYANGNLHFGHKKIAKILEPKLFRDANTVSVMNDVLASHYKEKYNKDCIVIYNSVSIPLSRCNDSSISTKVKKVVYTGTIDWPQRQAIINLIEAIRSLNDIEFHLYSPHDEQFLSNQGIQRSKNVKFFYGSPSQMPEIQSNADILFVGLSFDSGQEFIINSASPGKTYEYLISGRPILIHAPKNSYIAQYGKNHGFALVIDQNDIFQLREAVKKLSADKILCDQLTQAASLVAEVNHDAKKSSRLLQEILL